jgi:hypothetical protein
MTSPWSRMISMTSANPVGDGSPPLPPGCIALTMDPLLLDLRFLPPDTRICKPRRRTLSAAGAADVATVGGLALSAGPSVCLRGPVPGCTRFGAVTWSDLLVSLSAVLPGPPWGAVRPASRSVSSSSTSPARSSS